ncbi:DCE1 decarboxylase, partial [Sula dactylatra]|nr:DCE1 decarboxylase [Sula dactylatra]
LEVVEIFLSYTKRMYDGEKVLDFHHHPLLEGLEGFSLELSDQLEPLEQILSDCRNTLINGIKTGHPRHSHQLSSGLDVIGLPGEQLMATANTNMFTYAMAPVFTIMEQIFLKKMHEMIGW